MQSKEIFSKETKKLLNWRRLKLKICVWKDTLRKQTSRRKGLKSSRNWKQAALKKILWSFQQMKFYKMKNISKQSKKSKENTTLGQMRPITIESSWCRNIRKRLEKSWWVSRWTKDSQQTLAWRISKNHCSKKFQRASLRHLRNLIWIRKAKSQTSMISSILEWFKKHLKLTLSHSSKAKCLIKSHNLWPRSNLRSKKLKERTGRSCPQAILRKKWMRSSIKLKIVNFSILVSLSETIISTEYSQVSKFRSLAMIYTV